MRPRENCDANGPSVSRVSRARLVALASRLNSDFRLNVKHPTAPTTSPASGFRFFSSTGLDFEIWSRVHYIAGRGMRRRCRRISTLRCRSMNASRIQEADVRILEISRVSGESRAASNEITQINTPSGAIKTDQNLSKPITCVRWIGSICHK